MRKNTAEVMRQFFMDRKGGKVGSAVWTDGRTVYSYGTAILTRNDREFVLNRTRYSNATTVHQNAIASRLAVSITTEVFDLPQGCDCEALLAAADHMAELIRG